MFEAGIEATAWARTSTLRLRQCPCVETQHITKKLKFVRLREIMIEVHKIELTTEVTIKLLISETELWRLCYLHYVK